MKNRLLAAILILVLALSTVACSSKNIQSEYDPTIEPFGYESSADSSLSHRPTFYSIDDLYVSENTNTVLVVTPVSDFTDRIQVGSTEMPSWHVVVAPCEVLAVIKNDPGPNEAPIIEVGDTINIMESMRLYEVQGGKVILFRYEHDFFPMQKGQPYLWFGSSGSHEMEGVDLVYRPIYGAFDISQREVTNYEVMAMTPPDNAPNQNQYVGALNLFTKLKRDASESAVFSPYFDEYAEAD